MTFLRIVIPLYLLFEHDLRANASRLSRGKTGTHPSGRGPRAGFSGSCSNARLSRGSWDKRGGNPGLVAGMNPHGEERVFARLEPALPPRDRRRLLRVASIDDERSVSRLLPMLRDARVARSSSDNGEAVTRA